MKNRKIALFMAASLAAASLFTQTGAAEMGEMEGAEEAVLLEAPENEETAGEAEQPDGETAREADWPDGETAGEADWPAGETAGEADSVTIETVQEIASAPSKLLAGDEYIVEISADNFPDLVFRERIRTYDKDGNGILSAGERAEATILNLDYSQGEAKISDLTGIGYFGSLTRLYCSNQDLTGLDVSQNTNLSILSCSGNSLTELELGDGASLTSLRCSGNKLETLDLSGCVNLESLDCEGNNLTVLSLENNAVLQILRCGDNALSELDVRKNTALESLYCSGNGLTSLDLCENTKLTSLGCSDNNLRELDLSQNTELVSFLCANNLLKTLDLSGKEALRTAYVYRNQLTSLNVAGDTALIDIDCAYNQLSKLDVSRNPDLQKLRCAGNQLLELDVSGNPALLHLYCQNNQLESLDLGANPELISLNCSSNCLGMLDLSANGKLQNEAPYFTSIGEQKVVLPVRVSGGCWKLDMEEIVGSGRLSWILDWTPEPEDGAAWDGAISFGQGEHPDTSAAYTYSIDTHIPVQENGETADWGIMSVQASVEEIPHTVHTWGEWTTLEKATVFTPEQQERVCLDCGTAERRSYGEKLQPIEIEDETAGETEDGSEKPGGGEDAAPGETGETGGTDTEGKDPGEKDHEGSGKKEPIVITISKPKTGTVGEVEVKVISLAVKQSVKLTAFGLSTGSSVVSWTSSNGKVASVTQNGKVTAKKVGTTKITVSMKDGTTATVKVKVQKKPVKTKTIRFTAGKTAVVSAGRKKILTTAVTPVTSSEKIRYYSSNSRVARVDSWGVVTGVKKGTATITAKSGTKSARIKITVK